MKKCVSCGFIKSFESFRPSTRCQKGTREICALCEGPTPEKSYREKQLEKSSKKCTKCKELKPMSKFHKGKECVDGRASQCKRCITKKRMTWYHCGNGRKIEAARAQRNKQQHMTKIRANQWARKAKLIQMAGGKCQDCGLEPGPNWPMNVFEFHHTGEKKIIVSLLTRSEITILRAPEELKNCVLLCSNCHKRRHKSVYHP